MVKFNEVSEIGVECNYCGILLPKKDTKEHKCEPAKIFEHVKKRYELEDKIKGVKMENPIAVREEKQPAILSVMESPEKAVEMYDSIKKNFYKLIQDNGEVIKVKGKDYVKYEGWQTIGTALGILPRVVEMTPIEGGYQAKAEAVLVKTGQVIGQAYAVCTKDEANWKDKPMFALMAMAQTRASGRALKMILSGFIAHLGWEATPAEEIVDLNGNSEIIKHEAKETIREDGGKEIEYKEIPSGGCTEKQQKAIWAILKGKGLTDEQIAEKLGADYGVSHSRELTKAQASEIIDLYGKK